MTGLVMMPRVWPAQINDVMDTIETCKSRGAAYKYCHGTGKAHYPVPALQRHTHISPWSVVTFEMRESYDHDNRVWDFDTETTAHAEWYKGGQDA